MAKKTAPLLPATALGLNRFGQRLRLARLRRKLTAKQVAERAGMTAVTLRNLEKGSSGVTIGAYLAVMQVLGIEQELDQLAKEDSQGRELQDARLLRIRRRAAASSLQSTPRDALETNKPSGRPAKTKKNKTTDNDWLADGDFVSADQLAALIDAPAPSPPKPDTRGRK